MARPLPTLSLPLLLVLLGGASVRGQAFIEHLSPPALERGKTTRLTVVGACLTNALDLWTSLPPGKVKAVPVPGMKSDAAVFDVSLAADAPVGLFGLRLATADGLSNVHLFLIDDLPVRPAPDSVKGPAHADLPCALWGRCREAVVDCFLIDVKAGQRVSFEAVCSRFGKEVDPLVILRDSRGRIMAERDNDAGLSFDCRFEHRFAVAGTYSVEIRDSRFHGHEHGFYVLRMGRFPAARVAVPAVARPGKRTELLLPELNEKLGIAIGAGQLPGPLTVGLRRPDDEGSAWLPVEVSEMEATTAAADALTPEKATPASIPGQLCGVLPGPGARQFFRLEMQKGQSIHVVGHGRWLNSPIDPTLTLTDAAGKTLRQANEGPEDTVQLEFSAPAAGVYCLAVQDQSRDGGPAYAYRLEVRQGGGPFEITAEVEGLTVPRESYQPVPLKVTRGSYSGPIELILVGAPPGVALTPSEIPAVVTALECKLSAAGTTPLGLHTVQILARLTAAPGRTGQPGEGLGSTVVHTRPLVDRQLLNPDLIPYSLREDQRRLPPSVSDRLALQITEPAPFTVDLAEPTVILARYQQAPIPLVMTRRPGFDGPITFTARGGQLADKEEGRTRVYAEFPAATAKNLQVQGSIHSRILTNLGKTPIEVRASGVYKGRTITLLRSFELEIRPAFAVSAEPALVKLAPGSMARVRLVVDRARTFTGPVTVSLSPVGGLDLPEKVTIPRGEKSVEIVVKAQSDAGAGRRGSLWSATADVDGFEEENRSGRFDVEVLKAEVPKK
jgi:hypothetical protein